jgi:hypothetical protein
MQLYILLILIFAFQPKQHFMIEFVKEAMSALEASLCKIENSKQDFIVRMSLCHEECVGICEIINTKLLDSKFLTIEEQIHFFKIYKPKIFAKLMYYKRILELESQCLGKNMSFRKGIIIEYLHKIQVCFEQHEELYQYYKDKRSDMDENYFTLIKKLHIPIKHYKSNHILFSTSDILFAKFMALEEVEVYLSEELQRSIVYDRPPDKNKLWRNVQGFGIEWTGTQRDLVELIYGLHITKSFNYGNVKLKSIMDVTNYIFGINMSSEKFYLIANQLKNRKKEEGSFFETLKKSTQEFREMD